MTRWTVAATALLLALPALAKAPTAPAPGAFLTEAPQAWPVSRMRRLRVIGLDHNRVGEIEDVVIGADGRAQAVVIGVGGFLGIGEKRVAVPFDQILWNTGAAPSEGPRASTPANQAGQTRDTPPTGPERMLGAGISNEVLNATQEQRSGVVNPASGPVTPTSPPAAPATVPVGGDLQQGRIRLTQSDLEAAPTFQTR